jgi:hypothetical protein
MPEKQRRPTVWIVLTCVFAVAAVGLGIWALSAKSDADDANAKLSAQQNAATATPTATPTAAATETATAAPVDPELQGAVDEAQEAVGGVTESADELKNDLDQAAANVDEAQGKTEEAGGALDKLQAQVDAFKAQAELTKTCLRGSLGALEQAFSAGGAEAAVEQLKTLAGQCRSS